MTPVIVVPPSHGELADCAQNGGAFRCRYTPEPGFVGRDAFKWQAAIGPYVSAIGTYTIDVIPYPPPSASSGVAVMVGDRTNELRLFHSYTPATVTFEIVSSPSHGLLAGCEWVATSSAVVCEYTPEPGFRGDDSLTWRWTDGEMWSDPGQITLRVIDDHRPDVTEPPPAITREAKPVKVSITATDRDGDVLTIDVVEPPLHGILTDCADLPWDGQYGCTYHPEPGFVGRDRFVWSVSDGQAAPVRRTAGIDVREDQPPVAAPATWTTRIGRTVFALLAVDDADDGNQLAATLVGRPLHGTVRETSGLYWQYTPDPGFAGTDSFTFRASDGLLETLPTAITVIVTDNDRPTAESQVVRLPRGRLASFHLAGADPDHDPLGYRYIEVPAHGVMGWGNNSEPGIGIEMLYLAEAGFTGWDHLTYIANDGVLDSEPATIWIGVGDVGAAGPPSPTPGPTASDDGTGGSGSPRLTLPPTDTDIVVGDPPESGIAPWVTTVLLVGALAVASLTRRRRAALRDPMRR